MGLMDLAGMQQDPSQAQGGPPPPDFANADNVGNDTIDAIQGTAIPQPRPGILEATTKVDPSTGQKTHKLVVSDEFFNNIGQLTQIGMMAKSAYAQHVASQNAPPMSQPQPMQDAQLGPNDSALQGGDQLPDSGPPSPTPQPSQAAQVAGQLPSQSPMTSQFLTGLAGLTAQQQAVSGSLDKQIQAAQAKQQFMEDHPLISAIGRLSSLAAANYFDPRNRLNGAIRAAGAFGQDQFGQSPGQLQGQISQLQAEKLQSQEGVVGLQEKGYQAEQARNTTLLNQQEKVQRDTDAIHNRVLELASGEKLTPETAVGLAKDYIARGGQADVAQRIVGEGLATQKAATDRRIATETFTAQQQANGFANAAATQARGFAQQQALLNQREGQTNKAAAQTDLMVKGPALETLKGVYKVNSQLGQVSQLYQDYANDTGVFAGRMLTGEAKLGLLNQKLSDFKELSDTLTPLLVKAYGEGARGFNGPAAKFNQAIKPSVNFDVQQNMGIIQGLQQNMSNIANGEAAGLSKAQVANYANLFPDVKSAYAKAYDPSGFERKRLQDAGFDLNGFEQKLGAGTSQSSPAGATPAATAPKGAAPTGNEQDGTVGVTPDGKSWIKKGGKWVAQ